MFVANKLCLAFLLLVTAFSACKKETFRAARQNVVVETKLVQAGCNVTNQASVINESLVGLYGSKVQVKGEFCALQIQQSEVKPLTLLIVIDESGSNGNPSNTDPVVGMGCMRLEAARTILKSVKDQLGNVATAAANVRLGLITFSTQAILRIPLTDIASFESNLNLTNFCSSLGFTNYEDAFDLAQKTLVGAQGRKAVYFFSDGQPSASGVSGVGPFEHANEQNQSITPFIDKGRNAAQNLRNANPTNFSFYAFYYKSPTATLPPDPPGAIDPQIYFSELTGDPSKAKVVDDVKNLPSMVQAMPPPPPTTVDSKSLFAEISAEGFGKRAVEMQYFNPDPNQTGHYFFLTRETLLFGAEGRMVQNYITVRATGSDGKVRQATANIQYEQK